VPDNFFSSLLKRINYSGKDFFFQSRLEPKARIFSRPSRESFAAFGLHFRPLSKSERLRPTKEQRRCFHN
jgi:hypothetical protein